MLGRLPALLGEVGRLRARAARGLQAAALWGVAGLLALVALGFFSAALFLALAAGIGAPLAALILGILYALLALVVALWARALPPPRPAAGMEMPPALAPVAEAVRSRPIEALLLALLVGALSELARRGGGRDH